MPLVTGLSTISTLRLPRLAAVFFPMREGLSKPLNIPDGSGRRIIRGLPRSAMVSTSVHTVRWRERVVDDLGHALSREIVNNCQDVEALPDL